MSKKKEKKERPTCLLFGKNCKIERYEFSTKRTIYLSKDLYKIYLREKEDEKTH